ncbi:MAG: SpoIVB peptidase [Clostridiales bacterium]|jgi:stage IV sporulation protein B|nr:SpoIVB peptidase [Clostridiales bacterium]
MFLGFSIALFLCSVAFYIAVGLGSFPSEIFLTPGHAEALSADGSFLRFEQAGGAVEALASGDEPVTDNIRVDSGDMTLALFGFPVKNVSVDILPETMVVPCGITTGIIIDTTGLMVLGTGAVTTAGGGAVRPCEGLIKSGDLIMKIDETDISSDTQFVRYLKGLAPGATVTLHISRGGEALSLPIDCAISIEDGKNKLGLWVRDSTKGLGTVTYYNPQNARFGALGHAVIDVDTKQLIPVKQGRLFETSISDVRKGKKGSPGELLGEVNSGSSIGDILQNTSVGLYGTIKKSDRLPAASMKIALQTAVREGPAVILANVTGQETRQYDIYIERVNRFSPDESKGMIIRITDQELIARTNGIVQGMSGCPIIQEGKVIGAVTHVFVQNPLKGYGIFIENMIRQERRMAG